MPRHGRFLAVMEDLHERMAALESLCVHVEVAPTGKDGHYVTSVGGGVPGRVYVSAPRDGVRYASYNPHVPPLDTPPHGWHSQEDLPPVDLSRVHIERPPVDDSHGQQVDLSDVHIEPSDPPPGP